MLSPQSPPRRQSWAKRGPEDAEMPYSETFTDDLMETVLVPPPPSGITVLEKTSVASSNGEAVRLEDAEPTSIEGSGLPLSLHDPRRTFRSPIPGVKLTHPGGPIEGGGLITPPSGAFGTDGQVPEDVREYARRLIKDNSLRNSAQLKKFVVAETQRQVDELRKQMIDRSDAKKQNEQTLKEIRRKDEDREMERKIEEKWGSSGKKG